MTRLHDLLSQVADQAQPVDDLSERALRSVAERRHLRLPIALVAAVSLGLVIAGVALGIPALTGGGNSRVVSGSTDPATIRFPDDAPDLPDRGVAPVRLTYRMTCKGPDGDGRDCSSWRVVTVTGQHFTVEGPPDPGETGGSTGVLVAPDGRRIAYLRDDGAFVLRDLASGRTRTLFRWDRSVVHNIHQHAWSPDGRWILAIPGDQGCVPKGDACSMAYTDEPSMLVDTRTGRTVPLGKGAGNPSGLPAGDRPFPFSGMDHEDDVLPLLDHSGATVAELPGRLMPGRNVDGMLTSISPDGSRLAVITFPKNKPSDVDGGSALVTIVDVEKQEVVRDFRIKRNWEVWDAPDFLGWSDDTTVLIATRYLKGRIPTNAGEGYPANVDAFDVTTGTMTRVLRLPDIPTEFDVAYRLH